jgi:hypothetical protein
MTLNFNSGILLFWRTNKERGGRKRTGFRDNFATLWAGFLVAQELLVLFGGKFSDRL